MEYLLKLFSLKKKKKVFQGTILINCYFYVQETHKKFKYTVYMQKVER